jgi:NAD(P)H-dependent FMN reductase
LVTPEYNHGTSGALENAIAIDRLYVEPAQPYLGLMRA